MPVKRVSNSTEHCYRDYKQSQQRGGGNMAIPSIIVFEEIKRDGFNEKPRKNAFGELIIGYGHKLVGSSLFFSKILAVKISKKKLKKYEALEIQRKEAKAFKQKKRTESLIQNIEEEILSDTISITEKEAEDLLMSDILAHYDYLSVYSKAFRHLRSECKNGIMYRENQLSVYNKSFREASVELVLTPMTSKLSDSEAALIRLDVLVYLFHMIGRARFFNMANVFEYICVNNYMDASAYMLGHKWGELLKEKAVICALRMKHGRIIRDVFFDCPMEEESQKRYRKKKVEDTYNEETAFLDGDYDSDELDCDSDELGYDNDELGYDNEPVYLEDFINNVDFYSGENRENNFKGNRVYA